MATNTVNIINLLNLPQAQSIVDGNFFIVQNELGTQIIDWADVPVVRVDDAGGSTITSLTATTIETSSVVTTTLSALSIFSNGNTGVTVGGEYYNAFTVDNGIVTSAVYTIGSPEYVDILTTQLPTLCAGLSDVFKRLYIDYTSANTSQSQLASSFAVSFTNVTLPTELSSPGNIIQPSDINWNCTPPITSSPMFSNFQNNAGFLSMQVDLNYTPSESIEFYLKVTRAY